jgi:hypothetical protein
MPPGAAVLGDPEVEVHRRGGFVGDPLEDPREEILSLRAIKMSLDLSKDGKVTAVTGEKVIAGGHRSQQIMTRVSPTHEKM